MAKFNRSEKFGVDIPEIWLYDYPFKYDGEDEYLKGKNLLQVLLFDHSTNRNIVWGTDDYGFPANSEITPSLICDHAGEGAAASLTNLRIRPRVEKDKDEQSRRTKDRAEVFTPSWVCNKQINLVDAAWFGRENVFNTVCDTGNTHIIKPAVPVVLKGDEFQKYINDHRIEITCGEAPYLVNRYDTVSGELISDLNHRVGLLDRKLRLINQEENVSSNWIKDVKKAYMSLYGYEWQGDNLLLAREAMLYSFIEYYRYKWNAEPNGSTIMLIAEIISWNIWQMDGISNNVPYTDIPARIKYWGKLKKAREDVFNFSEIAKE